MLEICNITLFGDYEMNAHFFCILCCMECVCIYFVCICLYLCNVWMSLSLCICTYMFLFLCVMCYILVYFMYEFYLVHILYVHYVCLCVLCVSCMWVLVLIYVWLLCDNSKIRMWSIFDKSLVKGMVREKLLTDQ